MKYLCLLSAFFLVLSCGTTNQRGAVDLDDKAVKENTFTGTAEQRLAQMIRRAGNGALVTQQGETYYVKIRGASSSFNSDTSPLFVLNGVGMGTNFNQVADAIAGSRIKTVRVLKGQDASFYGSRGAAGVIAIKTAQ